MTLNEIVIYISKQETEHKFDTSCWYRQNNNDKLMKNKREGNSVSI